jgi:hypothetical protein
MMAPTLHDTIDRIERISLGSLLTLNLLVPLILFLAAWPRPWRAFDGETSPINWFSSAQCALIAALAFAVYALTLLGRRAGTDPIGRAWPWALFALGFLAMSADEALQGHERIREGVLKPRGIFTDIDFIMAGDVVLILYVVVGLVLSYFLFAELRRHRPSLIAFFAAVALIGFSAVQDSLDLPFLHDREVRHVQTIVEELAEIWAQLLFACSFLWLLFLKFRLFLEGLPGPSRPDAHDDGP